MRSVDPSSGPCPATYAKDRTGSRRPRQESGHAWSPDSRKIVLLADMNCGWTRKCAPEPGADGPRELWLMDADDRHLRQPTRNGGLGYDPRAWAAAARVVACR